MTLIKVSLLTYLYLFFALISGFIYEILFYYLALCFHELGHLVMIFLMKKKIHRFELAPIGGVIEVEGLDNDFNYKAFLIYIGGPLFSFILFLFAYTQHWSDSFVLSSFLILVLNLLPILPFDGGHLLLILCQNLWGYKKIFQVIHGFSILCLLIGIYLLWGNFLYIGIMSYFILLNALALKESRIHYHQFMLNKYLYPNPFLTIKVIKEDYYNRLYKGYNNSLYENAQFTDEVTMLKKRFKM